MVSPDCFAVLDVCFARFSQLTVAGAPKSGNFGYTSDSAQKVTVGLTVKAGTVFTATNGCGAIKANVEEPDTITGATVAIDLTLMEHELLHLLCGGDKFTAAGHTIGWQVPHIADAVSLPICAEFWSKAIDGSAPAVTANTTPNAAYEVTVLPLVIFTFQPYTLANGFTTYAVSGKASENTAITANGPWNDWPTGVSVTSVVGMFETATLPTAACALEAVPAGS